MSTLNEKIREHNSIENLTDEDLFTQYILYGNAAVTACSLFNYAGTKAGYKVGNETKGVKEILDKFSLLENAYANRSFKTINIKMLEESFGSKRGIKEHVGVKLKECEEAELFSKYLWESFNYWENKGF